jgi:hypothetical protein
MIWSIWDIGDDESVNGSEGNMSHETGGEDDEGIPVTIESGTTRSRRDNPSISSKRSTRVQLWRDDQQANREHEGLDNRCHCKGAKLTKREVQSRGCRDRRSESMVIHPYTPPESPTVAHQTTALNVE